MSDAGRILIMPKGTYDASTSYELLDLVKYNDVAWLARKAVVGIEPREENSEYWFRMAGHPLADNLETTEEGYALDARQGKALMDAINGTQARIDSLTDRVYGTFEEMVSDSDNLKVGYYVRTLGYHAVGDYGGCSYHIVDEQPTTYHKSVGSLYAEAIFEDGSINLATTGKEFVNEMLDDIRPYMREHIDKRIVLPVATLKNPACKADRNGTIYWKANAPVVFDDNMNNCNVCFYGGICMTGATETNVIDSIVYVGGSKKPENIYFERSLGLLADTTSRYHVRAGIRIANGARIQFNDCTGGGHTNYGIIIGGTDETNTNPVDCSFNTISTGYNDKGGVLIDGTYNLCASFYCARAELQAPYVISGTENETVGVELIGGSNESGGVGTVKFDSLGIGGDAYNNWNTALKISGNTAHGRKATFCANLLGLDRCNSIGTFDYCDCIIERITGNTTISNFTWNLANTTKIVVNDYSLARIDSVVSDSNDANVFFTIHDQTILRRTTDLYSKISEGTCINNTFKGLPKQRGYFGYIYDDAHANRLYYKYLYNDGAQYITLT